MKKLAGMALFIAIWSAGLAQEPMDKIMERRAREMHRVIGLTDPEQWRKFVKENYTQTLIDKVMQAKVQTSEDRSAPTTESSQANNLEGKVKMFERLHNDFGATKIVSIKSTSETLQMVLEGESGTTGTFQLKFDKNKPYLIDGLGIKIEN